MHTVVSSVVQDQQITIRACIEEHKALFESAYSKCSNFVHSLRDIIPQNPLMLCSKILVENEIVRRQTIFQQHQKVMKDIMSALKDRLNEYEATISQNDAKIVKKLVCSFCGTLSFHCAPNIPLF